MYTIQLNMATAKEKREGEHQNITIRLKNPEFERYKEVLKRAYGRNSLADKSKVIRELLGLQTYGLLKPKDISFFQGKPLAASGLNVSLDDEAGRILKQLSVEEGRSAEEQAAELILEAFLHRGLVTDRVEQSDVIFLADYLPKPVKMKLLGEIAAGEPLYVFERSETIEVPAYKLKSGKNYFVLRVRGNSMTDEGILDGSFIICESAQTAKKGDRVVALIDGDKATVKKYYPERERIRLQPANKLHKPIYIEPERLKIQGIVIGTWRP